MKNCRLTNISRINPKYHGRCRRYVVAGKVRRVIKPDVSIVISDVDISNYRFHGDITWDKDASKWKANHVLLAEVIVEDAPVAPPCVEPQEPEPPAETEELVILVELEEEEAPAIAPVEEPEPPVETEETVTIESLEALSLSELYQFKMKNKLNIPKYRDLAQEDKVRAVYEALNKA